MKIIERTIFIVLAASLFLISTNAQESKEIRILVRGDDMGMSHSINQACIAAYRDGVMRSVEVMVSCPWFPEAVNLLKENPGLEVGVHLVLNSEWDGLKYRPLTSAPSLTDENGYFYPRVFPSKFFPDSMALSKCDWDSTELDHELRAQIDLALKHIPQINHLSTHMSIMDSPGLSQVLEKVARDYNFNYEYSLGLERIGIADSRVKTPQEKETAFIKILEELQAGTWMLIFHPAFDSPEMKAISTITYMNVAADRAGDTFILTSDKVKEVINRRDIKLITYQDLLDEQVKISSNWFMNSIANHE